MTQKIEQWIRDAVEELWDASIIFKCEKERVTAIIASHAPSGCPMAEPRCPGVLMTQPSEEERIWCMKCGKSVSTPVPKLTFVRAWVQCPECIESEATEIRLAEAIAAPPNPQPTPVRHQKEGSE